MLTVGDDVNVQLYGTTTTIWNIKPEASNLQNVVFDKLMFPHNFYCRRPVHVIDIPPHCVSKHICKQQASKMHRYYHHNRHGDRHIYQQVPVTRLRIEKRCNQPKKRGLQTRYIARVYSSRVN